MPQQLGLLIATERDVETGAQLLQAGFAVIAFDARAAARTAPGTHIGKMERAPTLTDFGLATSLVVSTLEDLASIHETAIGTRERPGFAHELRPGSIVVDFGLSSPDDVRRLAGVLAAGGISVVDVAFIASGSRPLVLAGGWPDAFETARPILEALGDVRHAGELGAAKALAALRFAVDTATARATEEARVIAERFGCDDAVQQTVLPLVAGNDPLRLAAAQALVESSPASPALSAAFNHDDASEPLEIC